MIRTAVGSDVDAVVRLEEVCLGEDAWSRGLVEQGIAAALPTVSYLVAEVDGTVVGHAVASAAGDDAELQRIAVDPAYRRRGLAGELLAAVEERAARQGARASCCWRCGRTTRRRPTSTQRRASRRSAAVAATTGTVPPRWSWGRT